MLQKPKGTRDILPNEIEKWQYFENIFKNIVENYGFKEIRIPLFESTDLFLRGVGDTTDVVQKEMYTFNDKGDRSITLRPEATAGCVRAYIENGMSNLPSPLKLWYNITAYRYENVQKGRYREFRQLGVEIFGADSYKADAEIIIMATDLFKKMKLTGIKLELNSIGCKVCRSKYQEALKKYVKENLQYYCNDCKNRLERNSMRILDCKEEGCKKANENAPSITEYLCEECKTHFENLKKVLNENKIEYTLNPKLVRGLDYYNKTVFEFISSKLGFTILGGGRYDNLIEELGGTPTTAVGFGMGLDRLIDTYSCEFENKRMQVYIATIGDEAEIYATKLIRILRENGIYAESDILGRSINAQFKYANKKHTQYVITIGENEIKENMANIKNMDNGEERKIDIQNINEIINILNN